MLDLIECLNAVPILLFLGFWTELLAAIAKQQLKKGGKQTMAGTAEEVEPIDLIGAVKSALTAEAGVEGGEKFKPAGEAGIEPTPLGERGDIVTTTPYGPIIGEGERTLGSRGRMATPYESMQNLGRLPTPPPQAGLPPAARAPSLDRYGVPEAFGKAFVGMPMERERMGPAAYTGAFIPDVLRSKLGLSTVGERQRAQATLAGQARVYRTKDEIPKEMRGMPLQSVTPVRGGFKATYRQPTNLFGGMEGFELGEKSADVRYDELKKEGKADEEIYRLLALEGY